MILDVNPFVYSHPLPPEDVIDREEECRQLLAKAVGGHYVRLYAPRKYGKTSLLTKALRDGLIRSHIQHQASVASYVFAGSEPGLMRQLFEHKDRPLYGSAVPMRLQRLSNADLAAYAAERFRQTGRGVGDALNPLLDAAQGHPQRAMLLAHRLWEAVEPGATATLDDWRAAHRAALEELEAELDARWRGFDTSQEKTLRAIVAGEGSS